MADPFGHPGQPQDYVTYRPDYPPWMFESVVKEAEGRGLLAQPDSLLVDVATGTGKVIVSLAPHFHRALGFDRSKAQLSAALTGPNIEYAEADAYSLPLPDQSVSVITIGMALHWLDVPRFMAECKRLLRPHGFVAVLGYTTYDMFPHPALHAVFRPWWDSFRPYDEHNMWILEAQFKGTDLSPLTEASRRCEEEVKAWPLDIFGRYVRTWSPVCIRRRLHPDEPDTVAALQASLQSMAEKEGLLDEQGRVDVHFPFFLLVLQAAA